MSNPELVQLGPFDKGGRIAAVVEVLDDVWLFFEQIDRPRGMTSRDLKNALQAACAAGVVTSSRDMIYNKVRYATTALGDAWQYGGNVRDWENTPRYEGRP